MKSLNDSSHQEAAEDQKLLQAKGGLSEPQPEMMEVSTKVAMEPGTEPD